MLEKIKFPDGFLWGAATSAHQVEGGNHNDWSEWEKVAALRLAEEARKKWAPWQQKKFPEMLDPQNYISGRACNHYNLYEKDFDIAKELGHNAHRFSIEWSRIEPEEGKFNEAEIEHYRKVIQAIKDRGMEPFVTLWHWTNPLWLAKIGGPESSKFSFYFSRYAAYVANKLGKELRFWLTINEPTSVIAAGYMQGYWPPQKKNSIRIFQVYKNFARAHNLAYDIIHKINPNFKIGFGNILLFLEPFGKNNFFDRFITKLIIYFSNEKMLKMTKNKNDFLTVQYYFHHKIKFPGIKKDDDGNVTDMGHGWEIYPRGIYEVIKKLKQYNLPIYITENGLADKDDVKREKYIKDHLSWMHKAMQEGIDIRGYFYWSLLDNFEWDKGFWPRFGLVEMDYKTQERKIRPSALEYAKICKSNELEI